MVRGLVLLCVACQASVSLGGPDAPDAATGATCTAQPTIVASGLGTISEIFNGDSPFAPTGGIAQAWSVAELFRTWQFLSTTAP